MYVLKVSVLIKVHLPIPQLGILYLWVEHSYTPYILNAHGGTP